VAVWYYTPRDEIDGGKLVETGVPITAWRYGLTFHLGTLAWSALVVGLFRIPATVIGWLDSAFGILQSGVVQKACCGLPEIIVKYVQSQVYADVACSSKGFLASSINAAKVTLHYSTQAGTLALATTFFQFLGVAACGLLGFVVSMSVILGVAEFTAEGSGKYVENPLFVSLISAFVSAFISLTILAGLGRTADTLLYCVLQDDNRNSSYLYYSPPGIRELVGK
jgi:hypothetical protein